MLPYVVTLAVLAGLVGRAAPCRTGPAPRMIGPVPTDHRSEFDLARGAADRLAAEGFGGAVAAIQTGSGIPAPRLAERRTLEWSQIEGMPRSTAPGHRGALHHGLLHGVAVLVLEGRLHLYEGHAPAEVIRPVRAVGLLGVRNLLLTNASGGVRPGLGAGDVVRIVDHVNLTGVDPLVGIHDPRFGERFPVTAGKSHDTGLGALAVEAAVELGIALHEGVYAAVTGPCFETPAEVRRLRTLGVDVVGMSTVPEVLAATQLGMRVLALSLVANPAGVVAEGATAEREVLEVGAATGDRVTRLIGAIVQRLAAQEWR